MDDAPTILYVEDNADNRKLVSRVLQAAGFNFQGAPDSATALHLLQENIPDLILMDINLPEIDGYTLTKQLRQKEELAQIPIIALTANVMKADRMKSIEAGCDGFIQKPVNIDTLPDQIRYYLQETVQ